MLGVKLNWRGRLRKVNCETAALNAANRASRMLGWGFVVGVPATTPVAAVNVAAVPAAAASQQQTLPPLDSVAAKDERPC